MAAARNGHRSCRELITEMLGDDQPHDEKEIFEACSHWAPSTVTNTLSALMSEGAVVRQVSITFQTDPNRRKSNG